MKIYIDPDIQLVRELVEAIQNRIKKRPLSRTASLVKIEKIFKEDFRIWSESAQPPLTEKALVEHFKFEERKLKKSQVIEAYRNDILEADENKLRKFIFSVKTPGET